MSTAQPSGPTSIYGFLGLGLVIGWEQGLLLSERLFSFMGIERSPNDLFSIALIVAFGATLLCSALFAHLHGAAPRTVPPEIPAASMVACSVLFSVAAHLALPAALVIAAALLGGIGAALSYLQWLDLMRSLADTRRLALAVGTGAVGTFLGAALLTTVPSVVSFASLFLLPIAGTALFRHQRARMRAQDAEAAPSRQTELLPALRSMARSLACLAVFAIVCGIIGQTALDNPIGYAYASTFTVLAYALAAALFLLVGFALKRAVSMPSLYKLAFPVALALLLLIPFVGSTRVSVVNLFVVTGYQLMSLLVMYECTRQVQKRGMSSFVLNGAVRGAESLVVLVGVAAGVSISEDGAFDLVRMVVAVSLCVYLLATGLLFITNKERRDAQLQTDRLRRETEELKAEIRAEAQARSDEQEADGLSGRCSLLAERHGLTKREEEVLLYVARGRSSSHIAQKLVIAQNTVKGYMKNVYAKTGVHTKQELLDLLEQMDR